jgi:hypothetical protein
MLIAENCLRTRMSRSEKIGVVDRYFKGLIDKDLTSVPFAANISFEGPLMPKLTGRETILGFLNSILPMIKGIQVKQHIVDGVFLNLWATDHEQTEAAERAAVQFRHDHTSGASEF